MTIHHVMFHSGKLNCRNICDSFPFACAPQAGASLERGLLVLHAGCRERLLSLTCGEGVSN